MANFGENNVGEEAASLKDAKYLVVLIVLLLLLLLILSGCPSICRNDVIV